MTTRFEWDKNSYGMVWICDTHEHIVSGPATQALSVVGSVLSGASALAGIFRGPKAAAPVAPPAPPAPMPTAPTMDTQAIAQAQAKQAQMASLQSGRLSTVLTTPGSSGSDKLG